MVSADRSRMPHFCPYLKEAWNVVPYSIEARNIAPEIVYPYQSRGSCVSTNAIRALQQNTVRPALSVHPLYPYQSQGSCMSTNVIRALQQNTVRPALSIHPLYLY